MSENIQNVLGLPEKNQSDQGAGVLKEFGEQFRKVLAKVNEPLRVLSVDAARDQHQQHDGQRAKIVDAYQKAADRAKSSDSTSFEKIAERVISATETVAADIAKAAADVVSQKETWQKRETEFDDAVVKLIELDEAGNPKTSLLRQIVDAIQGKANGKNFADALSTLESFLPKFDKIYAEHQQHQASASGTADEFRAELASLEQAVEQLIAEHQLPV